jgi:hypothetical protein
MGYSVKVLFVVRIGEYTDTIFGVLLSVNLSSYGVAWLLSLKTPEANEVEALGSCRVTYYIVITRSLFSMCVLCRLSNVFTWKCYISLRYGQRAIYFRQ